MNIATIILGAIAIGSIVVIASSAMEAKRAQDKCNAYLDSVRERSKQ